MSDKDTKDIVILMTVSEKAKMLKIVISGAPQGEMPVICSGLFADRYKLLDQVWVEIKKRQPQVVKVKSGNPVSSSKKTPQGKKIFKAGELVEGKNGDDQSVAEDEHDEAPDAAEAAIDAQTPPITEPEDTIEEAEENLPEIEVDESVTQDNNNPHRALDTVEDIDAERDDLDADQDDDEESEDEDE
jgi:hypothetical protein